MLQWTDTETRPPQDADGNYFCYRKCADGTPCRKISRVPGMPCHVHFDQPPMTQIRTDE